MKKIFTLLTFFTFSFLASVNFTTSVSAKTNVIKSQSVTEVITILDEDELLKYGEENNIENYQDLTSITIVNFNDSYETVDNIDPVISESSLQMSTMSIFGAEYYIKNSTVKPADIVFGPVLDEVFLPANGVASMHIYETFTVSVDYTVHITDTDFYDSIGYRKDLKTTVDERSTFYSNEDYNQKVVCYRQDEVTEFQIWEDDIWQDDYIGTYHAVRPVGLLYATFRAN